MYASLINRKREKVKKILALLLNKRSELEKRFIISRLILRLKVDITNLDKLEKIDDDFILKLSAIVSDLKKELSNRHKKAAKQNKNKKEYNF